MASELDSSLLTPSVCDSVTSSGSCNTASTAKSLAIQQYTRPPIAGEPDRNAQKKKLYYCRFCETDVYSTVVTTNLRRHVKSQHNIDAEATKSYTKSSATKMLYQL